MTPHSLKSKLVKKKQKVGKSRPYAIYDPERCSIPGATAQKMEV